jgi:eukaryotic-like serine/threonine-protein kinase
VRVCPECLQVYGEDAGFCSEDGAELRRSEDALLGRTLASRYRLIKKLGTGGMSTVYLARHVLIDRLSAIKILRPDQNGDPTYRERFLREAKAVNRINHRNIVEISDVGEVDGIAYLVMEYVSGATLLDTLRNGLFDWQRALSVTAQLASALVRVHQAGVIHRDLKPENVLVTLKENGELDQVKLTDFGIAKVSDMPAITFGDMLFGTPGYIAPELVEGKEADPRTDIYALGAMLYEMVSGKLPFEGKGQAELLLKPLTSPAIPISERVPDLPSGVQVLVMRMLARQPEERPVDASEVEETCAILLNNESNTSEVSLPSVPSEVPEFASVESDAGEAEPPTVEPNTLQRSEVGRAAASMVTPSLMPSTRQFLRDPSSGEYESVSSEDFDDVARPSIKLIPSGALASATETDWEAVLLALEASIRRATIRKPSPLPLESAKLAQEHASAARAMLPRTLRAQSSVNIAQAIVDALHERGRTFRGSLGKALDALLRERSRERMNLEGLRTRRRMVAMKIQSATDTALWEAASLAAEEHKQLAMLADLTFQVETLQVELDRQNEELEHQVLDASGTLEGALSGLRTLTTEFVCILQNAATVAGLERKATPII